MHKLGYFVILQTNIIFGIAQEASNIITKFESFSANFVKFLTAGLGSKKNIKVSHQFWLLLFTCGSCITTSRCALSFLRWFLLRRWHWHWLWHWLWLWLLQTDARLLGPLKIPFQGHQVSSDHLCKSNHDKSAKTLNKKPMVKVDMHTYHLLQ